MSEELRTEFVEDRIDELTTRVSNLTRSFATLNAKQNPGSITVLDGVTYVDSRGNRHNSDLHEYSVEIGSQIIVDPKAFQVPLCDPFGTFFIQPGSLVTVESLGFDQYDLFLDYGEIHYVSFPKRIHLTITILKFFIKTRGGRTGAIGTEMTVVADKDHARTTVCVQTPKANVRSLQTDAAGNPIWSVLLTEPDVGVALADGQLEQPEIVQCSKL